MLIINIKHTQVLITRFNEIPYARLLNKRHLEELSKLFSFSRTEVLTDETGKIIVQYFHGTTLGDEGGVPINRLAIEERRILFEVAGSSAEGDIVFPRLRDYLRRLLENNGHIDNYLIPIVRSIESELTLNLNFSFDHLISPTLVNMVYSELAQEASSELAEVTVRPAGISFEISYSVYHQRLEEHRISLNPKEFSIQPARGYPLSERIYYSKAPLDTNTHIQLLDLLESRFQ